MKKTIISLFIILVIFAIVISLQVFLSKRESKKLGLVLPILSFILSLFTVMASYAYDPNAGGVQVFVGISIAMFISNIPTIILLAIHFGIREKIKINHEIEKMSIKDLH